MKTFSLQRALAADGTPNGLLIAARTMSDAFDRLGLLEPTPSAIIPGRELGRIKAMRERGNQEPLGTSPGM